MKENNTLQLKMKELKENYRMKETIRINIFQKQMDFW